jgi:hypothetical protein
MHTWGISLQLQGKIIGADGARAPLRRALLPMPKIWSSGGIHPAPDTFPRFL